MEKAISRDLVAANHGKVDNVHFEYLLALGSNIAPREHYISQAIKQLSDFGHITAESRWYETKPLGPAQNDFINTAICLHSTLEPYKLLKTALDIETQLGRQRTIKWGPRTIDIDIILARFDHQPITLQSPELMIPHPECLNRDFVILPLLDIAPRWQYPGSLHSLADLARQKGYSYKALTVFKKEKSRAQEPCLTSQK